MVGVSTFFLDLAILYALLTFTATNQTVAIGVSFFVGVTLNFLFCYYWVYRGTERKQLLGYLFFAGIATVGVIVISYSTQWLYEAWQINIYIARTTVAIVVGIINFGINTFFNFRLY